MVGFAFPVYIVEHIDSYIKSMNNTFTKTFKKNASRNITYFIYADNLCIYYNAFLCVTVSDILEIIIWNHNTCIKL